mmetsp:Transcript_22489/g.62431  ORF Transcript_22489/g.62431 Transcript_22489/m.62431 type:complete len:207 (+) Transcript_22489:205-825(+)
MRRLAGGSGRTYGHRWPSWRSRSWRRWRRGEQFGYGMPTWRSNGKWCQPAAACWKMTHGNRQRTRAPISRRPWPRCTGECSRASPRGASTWPAARLRHPRGCSGSCCGSLPAGSTRTGAGAAPASSPRRCSCGSWSRWASRSCSAPRGCPSSCTVSCWRLAQLTTATAQRSSALTSMSCKVDLKRCSSTRTPMSENSCPTVHISGA